MAERTKAISFDPGGATGWVKHTIMPKGEPIGPFEVGCLMTDQHHVELWEMLEVYKPELVICEGFTYQIRFIDKGEGVQSPNIVLISRNYIGIIELWCKLNDVKLIMRQPGQEFKVWTNDKLRALGFYTKGSRTTNGAPHTNDAMRHLIGVLAVKMKRSDYLEGLRPKR